MGGWVILHKLERIFFLLKPLFPQRFFVHVPNFMRFMCIYIYIYINKKQQFQHLGWIVHGRSSLRHICDLLAKETQ